VSFPAFPDQSASFVHGAEFGILWHRMETEAGPIAMMVHSANKEVIVRADAALGWTPHFDAIDGFDEWTTLTLERSHKGTPQLRLVKSDV
jgi:hypothetical protein